MLHVNFSMPAEAVAVIWFTTLIVVGVIGFYLGERSIV